MLEFELVLPCYNESKSLPKLAVLAVEAAKQAGFGPDRFQLVLVNNGSTDDSVNRLQLLTQSPLGGYLRVVTVTENRGYGFGIWSGLQATTAAYVGWTHADEQCHPEDAFRALKKLKSMTGKKFLIKGFREGRDWKDRLVSRTFEFIAKVTLGLRVSELNAQPKVFSRALLTEITAPPSNFAFDLYVVYCAIKAGYKIETVSVKFSPRAHGLSNWASNFFDRYRTIFGMIRYMWGLARVQGRVR